jgi:hypothetical protein
MKIALYDMMVSRRSVLKGTTALAAAVTAGGLTAIPQTATAADDLRATILKIPGVGKGQPTDADWQKVGGMCLDATKASVKEGEFKGVELSFMGLNNQNVHNVLFRGLSKAWADYTGATIKWIDLAQSDYNARLQQSIATGTVDFDVIEMGAPFEGDVCGKGLASEMPDWVKKQIDMDDYVGYLKAPVGTTARPIASPAMVTATTSTIAQTSLPTRVWLTSGKKQAVRVNGVFRKPGNRSMPPPSSSRARSSMARTSMAISIQPRAGAVLPSISWVRAPQPMPSIPMTRPSCSMPTQ